MLLAKWQWQFLVLITIHLSTHARDGWKTKSGHNADEKETKTKRDGNERNATVANTPGNRQMFSFTSILKYSDIYLDWLCFMTQCFGDKSRSYSGRRFWKRFFLIEIQLQPYFEHNKTFIFPVLNIVLLSRKKNVTTVFLIVNSR